MLKPQELKRTQSQCFASHCILMQGKWYLQKNANAKAKAKTEAQRIVRQCFQCLHLDQDRAQAFEDIVMTDLAAVIACRGNLFLFVFLISKKDTVTWTLLQRCRKRIRSKSTV